MNLELLKKEIVKTYNIKKQVCLSDFKKVKDEKV